MPFGLARAPSTFQRVMQNTFMKELDEYVVVYLDDVLVYSKTKDLHYDHLRVVVQRVRHARLLVGLSKCELVTQKVQYLGFVIEPGGVGPDPGKVQAVQQWPTELLDRKQLRGFLGMVGYYRRLIRNFNKWAHPLYKLLREESDMTWWPVHTEAVQRLKDALATCWNKKDSPIAFESKKLGEREQFIPAYESELLAIVYALMKWKQLIGTKKVRIETDHATLGRMLTQKSVTPRLGYWLDKPADFDIEVVWAEQYTKCKDFREVVKACKRHQEGEQGEKGLTWEGREYRWENHYLWVSTKPGWRICVPGNELRKEVCTHFHDHILTGHPGLERTRAAIRHIFWWPGMESDIEGFVKSCVQCAKRKASHLRAGGLLQPLTIPEAPWEEIAMDLIVGLPKTKEGWDAILTVVCRLTKMAHFIPTRQCASTEEVAKLLMREVVRLHGVPSA
ncbi:retrotransposon ty3-gypsy subclass, partial [Cystoisospora suis]